MAKLNDLGVTDVMALAADWIEYALKHIDFRPTSQNETEAEDEFCTQGENLAARLRRP